MRHPRGGDGRLLTLVLALAAVALGVAVLLRRGGGAPPWPQLAPPVPPRPAAAAPAPQPRAAAPAGEGLEDLLALTKQELYARAQARDLPGRSRMNKRELAEALAAHDRA